jgi:Phage tail lysozyme
MADLRIKRSPNLDAAMRSLTDGTFSKMTGRKVKALTIQQAAAFLGNVIHETGSADLSNLDVVERGNGGAGRGMSQYTGDRRRAYDKAMRGTNANDINNQLRYAAEEYAGKHDPAPGRSLVGYTHSLENIPRDTRGAVSHLLEGYFRPQNPEASREARYRNAQQIEQLYPLQRPTPPPQPKKDNRDILSILKASNIPLLGY